jgi:hypothetical protein
LWLNDSFTENLVLPLSSSWGGRLWSREGWMRKSLYKEDASWYLSKLFDYLVELQTANLITEEEMEDRMESLRALSKDELRKEYNRIKRLLSPTGRRQQT